MSLNVLYSRCALNHSALWNIIFVQPKINKYDDFFFLAGNITLVLILASLYLGTVRLGDNLLDLCFLQGWALFSKNLYQNKIFIFVFWFLELILQTVSINCKDLRL